MTAHTRFQRLVVDGLSGMRLRLSVAAIGLIGVTITDLAAPWPLKIIFDHLLLLRPLPLSLGFLEGLVVGRPTLSLAILSSSIALVALAHGSLSYLQIRAATEIGHQIVYRLRRELFAHLTRLSLAFHNRSRAGELLTSAASDTSLPRDAP